MSENYPSFYKCAVCDFIGYESDYLVYEDHTCHRCHDGYLRPVFILYEDELKSLQQQDRRMKWLKCNGYGFLKYPDGTYRILKAQGNGFVGVEKPTNYRVRYYADLDTAIDKAMEAEK